MNLTERKLLQQIVDILHYQEKPSVANQGQALDGFSALANYNGVAKEVEQYLRDRNDP